jgi:hypothetical protein
MSPSHGNANLRAIASGLVVASLILGLAGNAGASHPPVVPDTWLSGAEMTLLRGSYVRCLEHGFRNIGYPMSKTALAKAFARDSEDMSLWLTSEEVRSAPTVIARKREYIVCQWFEKNHRGPFPR